MLGRILMVAIAMDISAYLVNGHKMLLILFLRPEEFVECDPPVSVNKTAWKILGYGCYKVIL